MGNNELERSEFNAKNRIDHRKQLELGLGWATTAYDLSQEFHHEAVRPLLLQVQLQYELGNIGEMGQQESKLGNVIFFHLGDSHPVFIKVWEELGDMYVRGSQHTHAMDFYEGAHQMVQHYLGIDHLKNLGFIKKKVRLNLKLQDLDSAYHNLQEGYLLMQVRKMQNHPNMSRMLIDLITTMKELGRNEGSILMIYEAFQLHLDYFAQQNSQFSKALHERTEGFNHFLENYYECCAMASSICIQKHNSFQFLQEFMRHYFEIFMKDIIAIQSDFMMNTLGPAYQNRIQIFQILIQTSCFLAVMLLNEQLRRKIYLVVDRFHFDVIQVSSDSGIPANLLHSCMTQIIHQLEQKEENPYELMRYFFQEIFDQFYLISDKISENSSSVNIQIKEIGDHKMKMFLMSFRDFVAFCGYSDFKMYLLNSIPDIQCVFEPQLNEMRGQILLKRQRERI